MDKIKQLIQENEPQFLTDLAKIIAIPSVKEPPIKSYPFGKSCYQVLQEAKKIAQGYGLKTGIVENAVGYAQLGEGDQYIGVIGHLDVVPAGDGWHYPPFQLSEENNYLYGRGILDNKGPLMACLYALKLIKEQNYSIKRPIRVLFGTDEESGSHDLPLYLKKESPPLFGFTPDCKYPVVYGERGVVTYALLTTFSQSEIDQLGEIQGDQASDHVPDKLTVVYQGKQISVNGKRAPSNAPELGENALMILAEKILAEQPTNELSAYFKWLLNSFQNKHYGEGLGIRFEDQDSGKLMLTPFSLEKKGKDLILKFTIRYPISCQEEQIYQELQNQLPSGSQLKLLRKIPASVYPKESVGVRTLTKVYEEVCQLDGTPVTTTGATYARFMPNIVAFGPSFPGQKGIAHNQDEYMKKEELLLNMEIYMKAMLALANSEF